MLIINYVYGDGDVNKIYISKGVEFNLLQFVSKTKKWTFYNRERSWKKYYLHHSRFKYFTFLFYEEIRKPVPYK